MSEKECPCSQRYGDYSFCRGCGVIINKSEIYCNKCEDQKNTEMGKISEKIIEEIQDVEDPIFNQKVED